MRVLQLIDSLNVGGAERVAVNLANALADKIGISYICATRKEGMLKEAVNHNVNYLFLNRKSTFDILAVKKLNSYIIKHNIDIIHAHSSSFFLATLVKIINKKVKVVWHDHYGNREFLSKKQTRVLRICSRWFSYVFCVNERLEHWSKKHLKIKKVVYIPNFATLNKEKRDTKLLGSSKKRIICLANLRAEKDHENLIKAFIEVMKIHPDWTLHFVGKDFNDDYSKTIKEKIKLSQLNNSTYIYGNKQDVTNILEQADIAVLSSKFEGMPIALLEYGLSELPVVCTNVGDCSKVIINNKTGLLVSCNDSFELANAIIELIDDSKLRDQLAKQLLRKVNEAHSKEAVINMIMNCYKEL